MLIGKGCEDGGLVQTAAIKDLTVRPYCKSPKPEVVRPLVRDP
jgi:hypothetical protein